MNYRKKILGLIILLFFGNCIAAEIASEPCSSVQSSSQVDECAANEYKAADRSLNDVYKKVIEKIGVDYKVDTKLGSELLSALKKAQQAWIKFRDTNCAVESFEAEPGTAAHITATNICLTKMTNERIRALDQMLK